MEGGKSVDGRVGEEGEKVMKRYGGDRGKDEEVLLVGLKKGKCVRMGGWMGESRRMR